MPNQQLIAYLEHLGPQFATGLLEVQREDPPRQGWICLSNGSIVSAETGPLKDLHAILIMLTWDGADVYYSDLVPPHKVRCQHELDVLLFEFVGLEDVSDGTEEQLQQIINDKFKETSRKKRKTLLLPDMTAYAIYMETADPAFPMFNLEFQEGDQLIGSAPDCQILVDHPSVSGHHCSAEVSQTSITIKDLGSTNGTFVNREMVAQRVVMPSDIIQFGEIPMKIGARMKRKLARSTTRVAASEQFPELAQGAAPAIQPAQAASGEVRSSGGRKGIKWEKVEEKPKSNSLLGKLFGK